eukprot:gene4119-5155_t
MCILWIKPLIKDIKSIEAVVLKDIVDEEIVRDTDSEVDMLDEITPKPQYGVVQPEEPIRIAIRQFNKNPENGVQFIIENNVLQGTPYNDLVAFLHNVDELNKVKIGEYIGDNSPTNKQILQQFVDYYNFVAKEFDDSLREFLSKFRLPGEAQKIDRIMESFAVKYHKDNPEIFPDSDTAYILAFAMILLNTDAHNPAIKNKMSKKSFVQNNTGFKGKKDLPVEYLEKIYDRIIFNELKMDSDSLFSNALIKGWLQKMTSNEKKWQRRWFVLKNNCLYYFKNEKDEENPKVIIPLEGLKVTLVSDVVFEIEDSTVGTIKSVKLTPTGPVEGQHGKYMLKAPSIDEANKWVNSIRNNVLGSPVLLLIKKKKKMLNRNGNLPGQYRRRSIVEGEGRSAKREDYNSGTTIANDIVSREHTIDYDMSNASVKSSVLGGYDDLLSATDESFDDYSKSKQTENEFLF